jgi:ketosteroid isomerase-like protein
MKIKVFLLATLLAFIVPANAADHQQTNASKNIVTATKFMETLLTDRETADSLLHPDFDFLFMGISPHLSNVPYNKETYWSVWMDQVIAPLVPDGFKKVEVVDAIGDEKGVALMVEGDADGINGRYNNNYVFIFKFKEGKIVSLREYTSDLMVETRLYKQKLSPDQ